MSLSCDSGRSIKARFPVSLWVCVGVCVTYLLCVYLVPGPGLVLGTHGLQLSHMKALAADGVVGIQMQSQNPHVWADRCGNWKWSGCRDIDCLSVLVLPWHLMCGPAFPSGQGCNLIKHFGAGSPFPPTTLLKTVHWLPKHGCECREMLSDLPPRCVCTSHVWLSEFQFLSPTSLISCAHYPPGSSALWLQLQGEESTVAGQAGFTVFIFNPHDQLMKDV